MRCKKEEKNEILTFFFSHMLSAKTKKTNWNPSIKFKVVTITPSELPKGKMHLYFLLKEQRMGIKSSLKYS